MHFEREFAGEDYDGKNELKINVMKKTYHLCLSSEDEVMFRDTEDYNRGFNCFALALHKTGSTGLADAFMSNHFHIVVQTENPDGFMGAIRMPYCKYFNAKYGRTGRLGEKNHFCIAVEGLHHHLAVISYVFRNPLHHGVAPIAYAYPHSSVNAIFMKEMGKKPESCLLPQKSFYRHIGRRSDFPDSYRMSDDGLFLRESVMDVVQVENMFATPRTFDYYMNRKSSEEWTAEQEKDRNGASPVTLADIEYGITLNPLNQMLINEGGRANCRHMSDIRLCEEIDAAVPSRYGKSSIYCMSRSEREQFAEHLSRNHHLPKQQICRCLALPTSQGGSFANSVQ